MAALTSPVLINSSRAYWLSSLANDVVHSTITTQELDASLARFSTVFVSDFLTTSTLNASSFTLNFLDLSEANISTIKANNIFTSSQTFASGLSGGIGNVKFQSDVSGVRVSGDPIIFDNLVFLTSTINIIQISTLIDSDIFAQNGFFSTLSSGSITGGSLQISSFQTNTANISTLNVSSIITSDISGFSPSLWSLFPTLNSSILFNDSNVLSNDGNKLFFAGNELTDLSGGGQNWSRFNALQDVSMNNFSLRQLSTLQFQDSARLTSLTGNNLQYNNQQIFTGAAGSASNWSAFPAITNVKFPDGATMTSFLGTDLVYNGQNIFYGIQGDPSFWATYAARANIKASNSSLTVLNIQNNGSNITNGNTFTNSLGVGGLSAVPLASIDGGGSLVCRALDVGDSFTSLAKVNIFGSTTPPGFSALFVDGGVQFSGGVIHGFSAGVLPVGGINTGRIDIAAAGVNILHPITVLITSAAAVSLAAGGAASVAAGGVLSLAGGSHIEYNASDHNFINTSAGDENTTISVGNIQMPLSVANLPLNINNTVGGINLVGTSGKGIIDGFSSIRGDDMISPLMSTININLSTINDISGTRIVVNSGGLSIENFVSTIDKLQFFQAGFGNGCQINSLTSTTVVAPLVINADFITLNVEVDKNVIIPGSGGSNTRISGSNVSSSGIFCDTLSVSSINNTDARPAYINAVQFSTMNLFVGSTTLLFWELPEATNCNITASNYDIILGATGVYKVGANLQILKSGAGDADLSFFFLKNGGVIPFNSSESIIKNNDFINMYSEIVYEMASGDSFQVGILASDSNVTLSTIVGTVSDDSPAAKLTVFKLYGT